MAASSNTHGLVNLSTLPKARLATEKGLVGHRLAGRASQPSQQHDARRLQLLY